ncbi:MAG: TIGR00282 family metallophosphoesterase [Candidatus Omnitrophota bacterium]|nr:TIGR00282 family metallophosphoesterase [Candidatus Omnitrophota bacterium]MDZ4242526.1 TIGR00282 family metallophosphoesterase [Candidatus Omnitrophota bacterium]
MNILCIGDLVGKAGRQALIELLPAVKQEYSIDLTIANAENSAGGAGLTPRIAEQLFREGCDILTMGDHTWDHFEIIEYLGKENPIIRPANFPPGTPGRGWRVVTMPSGAKIGVINLLGRVFMRYNVECPFRALDAIVEEIRTQTNIIILDFHAETTSEKVAMGFYADGRITAMVGTHTHVQTADEKVLPNGTGYITDLGMTGPYDSVIGQNKEKILQRFLTSMPVRFEVATDDVRLHGVVVSVDEKTGKTRDMIRVQRRLP